MIPLAVVVAFGVAGCASGFVYFALLERTVALFLAGAPAISAIATTVLRIAITGAVFFLAARSGGLPLLTAFGGFLTARGAALRTRRSR